MTVNQFLSGEVINPITDARLERNLSGPSLGKRLGLSRQYISRAEQGTYASLNPALIQWAANALNIKPDAIKQRYIQFQKETRQATFDRVMPAPLIRNSGRPENEIFENWRSGYWTSPTQFAIAFCVHPDTVQKYEEGIQKKMPGDIQRALSEVNLIDEDWDANFESSKSERSGAPL